MAISDQELRELVRDAIGRRLHTGAGDPHPADSTGTRAGYTAPADSTRTHASHALLPVASGSEGDGPCFIEPAVRCNHCGYCQSYGH